MGRGPAEAGAGSDALARPVSDGAVGDGATGTVMFLMRDVAELRGTEAAERARLAGVLAAPLAGAASGGLLLAHARPPPVIPVAATDLVVATACIAFRQ